MLRKILQKILSDNQFQKIKESSKKWFSVCNKCGYSISVWDSGGIRFKAASKGKRVLGSCPDCKKIRIFKIVKKS
jgi:RNase P subunit RPR2